MNSKTVLLTFSISFLLDKISFYFMWSSIHVLVSWKACGKKKVFRRKPTFAELKIEYNRFFFPFIFFSRNPRMPPYKFTFELSCWFRYDITVRKCRWTLLEGLFDVLKYRIIRGGQMFHSIKKGMLGLFLIGL